jgi:polyphosphate glucokinase
LKWLGKPRWRKHVAEIVNRLIEAIRPDDVVLGGGHAKELGPLAQKCRTGSNARAFVGGMRMWKNRKGRK